MIYGLIPITDGSYCTQHLAAARQIKSDIDFTVATELLTSIARLFEDSFYDFVVCATTESPETIRLGGRTDHVTMLAREVSVGMVTKKYEEGIR